MDVNPRRFNKEVQVTSNVTLRLDRATNGCSGKGISITHATCVSVALGVKHAMRMRLIVICGLSISTIFFHVISRKKIFSKKTFLCVFWFSLQLCLKHFSFYEEINDLWFKMYVPLHVKWQLFLSQFNEIWISSTNFRQRLKYQISWKTVQWEPSCSIRTDRQKTWRS